VGRPRNPVIAEHIELIDAYDDLTQEAFAVWIRLHMFTAEDMAKGRKKSAQVVHYSEARFNVILRELAGGKYVRVIRGSRPGKPSTIEMLKICKVSNPHRFVRLSRFADDCDSAIDHTGFHQDVAIGQDQFASCPIAPKQATDHALDNGHASPTASGDDLLFAVFGPDNQQTVTCKPTVKTHFAHGSDITFRMTNFIPDGSGTGSASSHSDSLLEDDVLFVDGAVAKPKYPKRVRFDVPDGGICPVSETGHGVETEAAYIASRGGLDLTKFSKESRKSLRAKRGDLNEPAKPKHPDSGKPIDWDKLDKTGKPQVTFNPDEDERERIVDILTRNPRHLDGEDKKARKGLEDKYQQEFCRIYETYRREVLRSKGAARISYGVMAQERKYALQVAISCLSKGVTPRQLLEYWHENISNFAGAGLTVPPLTFLSQPSNVDTVAIHLMAPDAARSSGGRRSKKDHERVMHCLGDTAVLLPGLRAAMTEAGYDLTDRNDEYLVVLQQYATERALGHEDAYLPDNIRGMVYWIRDNYLPGRCLEDLL